MYVYIASTNKNSYVNTLEKVIRFNQHTYTYTHTHIYIYICK